MLAGDRQDSLFARLERPATVAGHNSPEAFAKYLDKVNENLSVLAPSAEGSDPFEADVWVLFFKNESEINSMPSVIKDLYAAIPKVNESAASRYIEFQLSKGGPKAASFHFLDNYGKDSDEVIACKAAVAVYSGVLGNTSTLDRKKLTASCFEQE